MGYNDFKVVDKDGVMLTATQLWALVGRAARDPLNSIFADDVEINMFAKYKPVKKSGAVRTADYWKANDGNCGITIPTINISQVGIANWTYDPPRGGVDTSEEPNFLNDFYFYGRYLKDADPIVCSGERAAITYNKIIGGDLSASLHYSVGGGGQLGIYDVSGIQDMYAAVALGDSATDYGTQTATVPLCETGGDAVIFKAATMAAIPNGNYNLYYYLRSEPRDYGDIGSASTRKAIYHGMGYLNPVPLTITAVNPYNAIFEIQSVSKRIDSGYGELPKETADAIHTNNGQFYFKLHIKNNGHQGIAMQQGEFVADVNGFYGGVTVGVLIQEGSIHVDANEDKIYTIGINFATTDNGSIQPVPSPEDEQIMLEAGFSFYIQRNQARALLAGDWFYAKNY